IRGALSGLTIVGSGASTRAGAAFSATDALSLNDAPSLNDAAGRETSPSPQCFTAVPSPAAPVTAHTASAPLTHIEAPAHVKPWVRAAAPMPALPVAAAPLPRALALWPTIPAACVAAKPP